MYCTKEVAWLLKRYFDYDYHESIQSDIFKTYMAKLNLFPLSLMQATNTVEEKGYVIITEPLLVYNKDKKLASLSYKPDEDVQVISKLSFDPVSYQSVLAGCESKDYVTTGHVITYDHKGYKAFVNVLIIAKDIDTLFDAKEKIKYL